MKDKVCPDYCGLACVDGTCPQIENNRYRCEDCWLLKGCEDCCFADECEKGGNDMADRYVKLDDVISIIKDVNWNLGGLIQHLKEHCPHRRCCTKERV